MQDAFIHNRDVYANIASIAFNVPYEKCLEFHPETGEYQPDGKARRSEAKTILLGRHNVMPTLIKLLFKILELKVCELHYSQVYKKRTVIIGNDD